MYYGWTTILREVKLSIVNSATKSEQCCMYTSFPNIHTKAVCALENGPGILIGKIWNCHIIVKKWKKNWKFPPKMKKNEVPWKWEKKWKNEKKWGVDSLILIFD